MTTEAPATASRHGLGYLPAVDGLRAISVAAVFLFHADVLSGGFLGVDVFLVISGFLITGLALAEVDTTGTFRLASFWARRARRLLPALFLLVATVVVGAAATGGGGAGLRRDVVATLAYVANWARIRDNDDYFDAFEDPSVLEHTWSLAVEEQFYILWPLLLIGLIALARSRTWNLRRTVAVASTLLAAGSVAWAWWLSSEGVDQSRMYFGTDTRAVGLAAGCAAACVLARGRATGTRVTSYWSTAAAVAGAGLLTWWAFSLDGRESWLYGPGFAAVAIASIALVRASLDDGPLAHALAWGPLPAIGRVSYGIYLWHWPIIVVLDEDLLGIDGIMLGLVWVLATAAATAASWWTVERRAPRPTSSRPTVGWTYGAIGVALAFGAIVAIDTPDVSIDEALQDFAVQEAPSVATATSPSTIGSAPPEPSSGAPPTTRAGGTTSISSTAPLDEPFDLLVLGDSVAESLLDGPPVPLTIDGRPVRTRNYGIVACPVDFAGRWVYDRGGPTDDPPECDSEDRFDDVVEETDPDLIVLMFGWPGTIAGREFPDGRVVAACDPDHDEAWATAHQTIADRYADRIVVAATVAPPQRFIDSEQTDRPGCLNRALSQVDVATFDWGAWMCPDDDCARAEALRRDPVHFSGDPDVQDLVWRSLLTQATGAAIP